MVTGFWTHWNIRCRFKLVGGAFQNRRSFKLREVIMLKDRAVIWVLEYVLGGILVLVPLALLGLWRPVWMDVRV